MYYRCAGKGAVRRSTCKNMVPLAKVDAMVSDFMAALAVPIRTTRFVPGHNHEAEILALRDDQTDATRTLQGAAMIAEIQRLQAEIDALADTEDVADDWIEEDSDETYAARWASLAEHHRGDWLRSAGIQAWASKGDAFKLGQPGPLGVGSIARAEMIERDGLRVVVAWTLDKLRLAA